MPVPNFKLNNGVEIPAIGKWHHGQWVSTLIQLYQGLGCWSGLTKEEQAAGKIWFLAALKV